MVKQTVTLIKTPANVLWAERGRYYKTAEKAKSVAMKEAREMARNGFRVYTFLEIRG